VNSLLPRHSDPLDGVIGVLESANRSFDQRTGFRLGYAQDGCPRLQYPPYVPAVPGYQKPNGPSEREEMRVAIHAWHERWFQGLESRQSAFQ
jgi:hypothetical protein